MDALQNIRSAYIVFIYAYIQKILNLIMVDPDVYGWPWYLDGNPGRLIF